MIFKPENEIENVCNKTATSFWTQRVNKFNTIPPYVLGAV